MSISEAWRLAVPEELLAPSITPNLYMYSTDLAIHCYECNFSALQLLECVSNLQDNKSDATILTLLPI